MPEIPEMEIYKNNLNRHVKRKRLIAVKVYRQKSLNLPENEFINKILNAHIQSVDRKGKYLIFNLDSGLFLLTHMMLDGRLYFLPATTQKFDIESSSAEELKKKIPWIPSKPSVAFVFDDKSVLLFCRLTLGFLHLLTRDELEDRLSEVGIDPLDKEFTREYFENLCSGKKAMIKPWLMDQKNLAGIGNVYSNEALFEAGILPQRQIKSLTSEEKVKLHDSLVKVIKLSIEKDQLLKVK